MKTVVTILLSLSLLATLGVFFAGMLGFARDASNPQRSNALMRWRVILQGLSLAFFILLMSLD